MAEKLKVIIIIVIYYECSLINNSEKVKKMPEGKQLVTKCSHGLWKRFDPRVCRDCEYETDQINNYNTECWVKPSVYLMNT